MKRERPRGTGFPCMNGESTRLMRRLCSFVAVWLLAGCNVTELGSGQSVSEEEDRDLSGEVNAMSSSESTVDRCLPENDPSRSCLDTGCPDAEICVPSGADGCRPSSCNCAEATGPWACTRDCRPLMHCARARSGGSCTYYSDASGTTEVGWYGKDCCNNTVARGVKTAFYTCGGCFLCETRPPDPLENSADPLG